MKPTFTHNVINSFFLWFDNFLMTKGDAYKTYTTKLYNYEDLRLGGDKVVYGSPYKQWVYDKNITGATIPSGFTINNQFSHFRLTKSVLHTLGYFDERLIGFGEEDGDIIHRFIEIFGQRMPDIQIPGIYNKASYELRNDRIETHIDNKPKFNREFALLKYKQDPTGIYGMSPVPVVKVIDDYQQYPYENFVRNNKHNIAKFEKVISDE